MVNSIVLVGRLVKDPETKVVNDKFLCKFSIAVNRIYQKDKADFFNCNLWGKSAEFIGDNCKKGDQVAIIGSVNIDKYNDKYYTSINCNNVQKLTPKKESQEPREEAQEPREEAQDIPF